MTYASEDIIDALKSARETKGLSQRALSTRTGVPQSHISKIENGSADIRLSSLIELARALELELRLVPRKAVPAVDSVVRSTAQHLRNQRAHGIETIAAPRPAYRLDDDHTENGDG